MIKKISYYLDFGSLATNRYEEFKTFKELQNGVKRAIDRNVSFEIYATITVKSKYFSEFDVNYEFAGFDHEKDTCYNYNLRKNVYYKRLKRLERKIFPILKTYGFKK